MSLPSLADLVRAARAASQDLADHFAACKVCIPAKMGALHCQIRCQRGRMLGETRDFARAKAEKLFRSEIHVPYRYKADHSGWPQEKRDQALAIADGAQIGVSSED